MPDRVRANTWVPVNDRLDMEAQLRMREAAASASTDELTRRIGALDREWDVERYLQMNARIVSLSGVVLGAMVNRRFLVLPPVVFGFFFQHATQGWCPPPPVFRKMGVRTRREINQERYALKALRGDFDHVSLESPSNQEER
jgi:hypothetical protein